MGLNALLLVQPDEAYGRSYMEHVVALSGDEAAPPAARQAARRLRDTPPAPPALVTLGKPDLRPLDDATVVVDYARTRAAALGSVSST